jgi:hypothetical protein
MADPSYLRKEKGGIYSGHVHVDSRLSLDTYPWFILHIRTNNLFMFGPPFFRGLLPNVFLQKDQGFLV